MPFELNSFIKEKDSDKILVRHSFYGNTEKEAETYKKHHLASCEYYRAAEKDGRTLDVMVEIDELPEFDEAELESFLELDDEEDEDEDVGGGPEDEEEE